MVHESLIKEVNIPELVKALRHCITKEDGITICEPCPYYCKGIECENVLHTDAAAAIKALQSELDQWKAAVKGQEDGIKVLQAEVKRLQDKLCDWCAVCPKERRKPEDCELLSETPVMYGPSDAVKVEAQDGN